MKHSKLLLLSLIMVACATNTHEPLTQPQLSADKIQVLTDAFTNAMPHTLQSLVDGGESPPLPEQSLTNGQITVVVEGHLGAAQTRDQSWIVQVGQNTRILHYSSSSGPVGAALNLPGSNPINVMSMQVTLPRSVVAEDALVVLSGPDTPMFSSSDEGMAVVFVRYPVSSNLLRPGAIGNSMLARYFRSVPVPESQVNMDLCPSVIDLAQLYQPIGPINPLAWGAAPPTVTTILNGIRKFSGEVVDGWPIASYAPSTQHIGYGTFFAGQVSTALCFMCSTEPLEDRRLVALAVVQRGLDQVGATCDGRVLYPLGGHCAGRKALVIATGHLLNVRPFATPSVYFPNVFQEDRCYFIREPSAWWFGAGWRAGWAFNITPGFNGDQLVNHPSTWGDPQSPTHSTFGWAFGYITQVVPAQVGTALAMRLMGEEEGMGAMCQMVRQFMHGPPQEGQEGFLSIGWNIPWGLDYATPFRFTSEAYKLYYPLD